MSVEPGPLAAGQDRGVLVAEVARVLSRVPEGTVVVVAASGGPDSAALAFLTAEARPDLRLVLVHVRHGLRPDVDDLAAVTRQASYLGARLVVETATVEPGDQGPEAAARVARYAALRRGTREVGAGWLLVGHTADDQAETVLLRLARGTGLPGLSAMPVVRGDVVRPMLRLRRADVHAFVAGEGLPVAIDPTNADRRFGRNQVRHEVLPALEHVAPDPVGALARLAALARDDAAALDLLAAPSVGSSVRRIGEVVVCPLGALAEALPAVARRMVRELVVGARAGGLPPTAAEVERIRELTVGGLSLSGVDVTAAAGWLAAAPVDAVPPPASTIGPGTVLAWPVLGWELVATGPGTDAAVVPAGDPRQLALLDDVAVGGWLPPDVDVDPVVLPPGAEPERAQVVLGGLPTPVRLRVRAWSAGDRVTTAGGTRKLQDVFTDAGTPRPVRPLHPVVVDDEDRVLWVPGLAADHDALLAGRAAPQLHLHVRPHGHRAPALA